MSAKQRAGSNVACEQPAPPLQNYTMEHRTCHKALISQRTISALKSLRDRYMSSSDMTEGSLTKQQITALPRIFHPRHYIGISQYSLMAIVVRAAPFWRLAVAPLLSWCWWWSWVPGPHQATVTRKQMSAASRAQQRVFAWTQ